MYQAIESTMKTKSALEKLKATPFKELPTISKVLARGKQEQDGSFTYQGYVVKRFVNGIEYFSSNFATLVEGVLSCIRNRIRSQETEILTNALTILATHGWEKSESASFAYSAIESIAKRFEVSLMNASIDLSLLKDEWEDMTAYAKRYLNLVLDYKMIGGDFLMLQ